MRHIVLLVLALIILTVSGCGVTSPTSATNSGNNTTLTTPLNALTISPSPPVGVYATGTNSVRIDLRWTAMPGATGYNVYRSLSPNVAVIPTNLITPTPLTSASFANRPIAAATTYYYTVTALNVNGESLGSAEVNATTAAKSLTAPAPGGLIAGASGASQINLTWVAASGATGYNIYRSIAPNVVITPANIANSIAVTTNSFTDTGLTANTAYYYKVTSLNAIGESGSSREVSTATAASDMAPAAPTSVSVAGVTPNQINVNWVSVFGLTYNVYRSTSPNVAIIPANQINTLPVLAAPYLDKTVATGITYYYRVTAVNLLGESGSSVEKYTTTIAAPAGFTATASGASQVNLGWTIVDGASGYNIYRATAPGVTLIAANLITATPLANASSFTDTGLTASTIYYYKVVAINNNNGRAQSKELSVITALNDLVPAAPSTVMTVALSGTRININWTNVPGVTEYNIYRSTSPNVAIDPLNKINTASVAGGPFANTGLTTNTTYYYVVTSVNANGESGASIEKSATTIDPPTGVIVTLLDSSTSLIYWNWSTSTGVTGYNIYASTSPTVAITAANKLNTTLNTTGDFTHTGLIPNTTYYYRVAAINANNGNAPSTVVSVKTPRNWTQVANSPAFWIQDLIYANGLFVAVGTDGWNSYISTSPDGSNWTSRTVDTYVSTSVNGVFSDFPKNVTYGNGRFVAVGADSAVTSTDGITWTPAASMGVLVVSPYGVSDVTYGNGQFVAVDPTGNVFASPDGITWMNTASATTATIPVRWIESITYGNGKFVALKLDDRSVLVSSDAVTWSQVSYDNSNFSWGADAGEIGFVNGLFIISDQHEVLISPDGINWTVKYDNINANPVGVAAFGNGEYLVPGNGIMPFFAWSTTVPSLIASSDGVNWTHEIEGPNVAYIAFGNGKFVACDGLSIWVSP